MDYKTEIIDTGDRASAFAAQLCRESFENNPVVYVNQVVHDAWRGPLSFSFNSLVQRKIELGIISLAVENDGAGGKPGFASLLGTEQAFYNLGYELLAMCADDLVRAGRLPLIMMNQVDMGSLTEDNWHCYEGLMRGYADALKACNLVNQAGETAIMKHSITMPFRDDSCEDTLAMTWSGACIGLSHRDAELYPRANIQPGMPIVALSHPQGYRCNGGTAFMSLIQKKWGATRKEILEHEDAREFLEMLTAPSICYAPYLAHLLGWDEDGDFCSMDGGVLDAGYDIQGIAHITGGGIWGKLRDILPEGVGALLDNMPEPPEVLRQAQELSFEVGQPIEDASCYGTFNGGVGMLIVCKDGESAQRTVGMLNASANGAFQASFAGFTVEGTDIVVRSQFVNRDTYLSSSQL